MSESRHKKQKTKIKTKKRTRTEVGVSRASMMLGRPRGAGLPASQVELKCMDYAIAVSPLVVSTNTNDSIFCLNALNQGSGSYTRIGRKINMKSVRVKGRVLLQCGVADNQPNNGGAVVRCVVVLDRSPNLRALPTWDDIFGTQDAVGANASSYLANLRPSAMERFRILKDWIQPVIPVTVPVAVVGGVTETSTSEGIAWMDEFIALNGLQATYFGTNGSGDPPTAPTVEQIVTNSILLCIRGSDVEDILTSAFAGSSRLRYTDA